MLRLERFGDFENILRHGQIGTDTDWTHVNVNGHCICSENRRLYVELGKRLGWSTWQRIFGNANMPTKVSGDIDWERSVGGWNLKRHLQRWDHLRLGYNRLGSIGGLGEVKSEYLDWTTDLSIIEVLLTS